MAYQALARKWRPRKFSEVVGQEHVVRALTHALEFDRMHHAYLFTGTRGVGKTTLARILAKAINCESRQGFDPCGECLICREVDEGRFVDLIEVDAASRTKVEDTRDLLENVQYAPAQGRFKIYLIDEVHMLSGHSFNALLKTLEEPPPHVKFLLATTDPQKIPVTVLSRCLQFNLKRLTPDQIRAQMETILRQEQIEYDQNAIRSLARAADGSMRDGLSLLDQAIVHGGGRLDDAQVGSMLGTVSRKPVFDLLTALSERDGGTLLARVAELSEHAPNYADVLQQFLIVLHHIALAQQVPETLRHDEDADRLSALASQLDPEDVQLFYQIGLIGQRDLPLAPEPRGGFEMVLLRMLAFRPTGPGSEDRPVTPPSPVKATHPTPEARPPAQSGPVAGLQSVKASLGLSNTPRGSTPQTDAPVARKEKIEAAPSIVPERTLDIVAAERVSPSGGAADRSEMTQPQPIEAANQAADSESAPPCPAVTPESAMAKPGTDWTDLIRALGLAGPALQLARNCVLLAIEESRVVLALDPAYAQIRTSQTEARLENSLQTHFGRPLKLQFQLETPRQETPALQLQREREERQRAAEREIEHDPNVIAIKERFEARIVPGSIKPID
ncbi:DNA polymerase III subunit gamma/tau [Methylococcus sp. EFPC2]|uniref:DNA polymerase III subunit gamma/tau n=1 Tax=Methylococcus sp. EFPC2 TaxID=2812648 RepID=UPI00196863A6|nr:DNA polymerase III subunit gamma/tau [Methylococcus sp. EFPC2]QSA98361.1 DNA polymerase III subunit gamma/tau [Methylococcus sp. EFPC2]